MEWAMLGLAIIVGITGNNLLMKSYEDTGKIVCGLVLSFIGWGIYGGGVVYIVMTTS